jgi:hypothetical protein
MLCKIRGFHGGGYEECRNPRYYVVWLCKNRRFERTYRIYHQSDRSRRANSNRRTTEARYEEPRLLVTVNAVPSSPILVNLKMEAILSSITSFLTSVARYNIADDGILHSNRCENLKPYTNLRSRVNFKQRLLWRIFEPRGAKQQ